MFSFEEIEVVEERYVTLYHCCTLEDFNPFNEVPVAGSDANNEGRREFIWTSMSGTAWWQDLDTKGNDAFGSYTVRNLRLTLKVPYEDFKYFVGMLEGQEHTIGLTDKLTLRCGFDHEGGICCLPKDWKTSWVAAAHVRDCALGKKPRIEEVLPSFWD